MCEMGVIFVGGVHGVGKTTACGWVAEELGVPHRSAGQIIRECAAEEMSVDKRVADVDRNQVLLIEGVTTLVSKFGLLLLDGHFSLFNADGMLQLLPVTVFQDLRIMRIICLTDRPEVIFQRTTARDGASLSVSEITEHQKEELRHARYVAESLQIPFVEVNASDRQTLSHIIKSAASVPKVDI